MFDFLRKTKNNKILSFIFLAVPNSVERNNINKWLIINLNYKTNWVGIWFQFMNLLFVNKVYYKSLRIFNEFKQIKMDVWNFKVSYFIDKSNLYLGSI